ncbi:cytidylate kinase [Anaerobacterium chartisolvens]|uniref:Cytidylate kinase n=1 Tax=Anaerobacterium chartisolvens TaxID=1297424 RepID=A0A369BHA9_9FIRM|nr:cytidylate kinase [Anaerobacterium chartisolvens]
MKKVNIAIDGPAGAGKSTIARTVSETLGFIYLDTGAMYRAVALKAIRQGINTRDLNALSELVKNIDVRIFYAANEQRVLLDNEDVTCEIRTPEISIAASDVAAVPEVRIKMVELQRDIAKANDVVMDGRDIGSYVLPDADVKIYLTATVEARALRRFNEQADKGIKAASIEEVMKDIEYRDRNDSTREFAPLVKAGDAVEIDTTHMSVREVVNKIISLIKEQST